MRLVRRACFLFFQSMPACLFPFSILYCSQMPLSSTTRRILSPLLVASGSHRTTCTERQETDTRTGQTLNTRAMFFCVSFARHIQNLTAGSLSNSQPTHAFVLPPASPWLRRSCLLPYALIATTRAWTLNCKIRGFCCVDVIA